MRLALILASNYEHNPRYQPAPGCALDGDLLEDRLAEPDARFVVSRVPLRRRLGSRLTREVGAATELVLYYSGYCRLVGGELKLVLDDDSGGLFSLSKLSGLASAASRLMVLDLVHPESEDELSSSVDYVEAARQALAGASAPALLIAARPAGAPSAQPSQLTRLLLLALESGAPLDLSAAYSKMRQEPSFTSLAAVGHFSGAGGQPALLPARSVPPGPPSSGRLTDRVADDAAPPQRSGLGAAAVSGSLPDESAPASASPSSRRLGTPPPKSQRGGAATGGVVSAGVGAGGEGSQADEAVLKSSAADEVAASSRRAEPDAAALFDEGRFDEALVAYKKQLLRLGSRRGPEHAQVFIGMARVKAAQGKADEALQSYDKALGITPLDAALFDEAKAVLAQGGDVARLAEWVRRRADAQQDPVARGHALVELGKIWLEQGDHHRAVTVLEAAVEADPSGSQASVYLADAFLGLDRPAQAVRALTRAGEVEQAPARRSAIWIRAAKLARDGLRGGEEVLELAGRALAADPQALGALELTSEVLVARRRYTELAAVYERALEVSVAQEDLAVRFEVSKRLGLLYRDQLDDIDGAKRSFQRAILADPRALELYYWQSELHQAEQRYVLAARQFQAAARHHADRPDVFRRALWLFEQAEDTDAAWNAAVALESLGDADINESLLADQHRDGTALNAQRATRPERWRAVLLDGQAAASGIGRVFTAIEGAALSVLEARSQHARWLAGATRQDPESTATLVRSLGWAARLLGVTAPELWIHTAPEVTLQLLPGAAPRRVVAPQRLGSGRDPRELAALWGYTLAGLVTPFSLVDAYVGDDLGRLLLSALQLGGAEGVELEPVAQQLTDDLSEYLTDADRAALREAVAAVAVRELGGQLAAWRAQIVLGRYRLGLLLAGDLEALPNVLTDLAASGLPSEEVLADLRGFSICEPYLALRQELGVEV